MKPRDMCRKDRDLGLGGDNGKWGRRERSVSPGVNTVHTRHAAVSFRDFPGCPGSLEIQLSQENITDPESPWANSMISLGLTCSVSLMLNSARAPPCKW